ncbi:MAG: hypothetical protein IT435_08045 [Phycisphaerales bacterium]|nr:hypothetical protein [Phycisphaerales bacterium]
MKNGMKREIAGFVTSLITGGCGRVLIASAGLAGLAFPAMHAEAQQRMMARSFVGPGGGGGTSQIGSRSIEKYSKMLDLTADQKETLKALHEGYQATYKAAMDVMQKDVQEASQAFEETEDHSIFSERMPAARKKFNEQAGKAEKEFFSDFKQILTPAQTAEWDRIDRARRRETILRGGTLSGESVDLVEIVDGLNLPTLDAPVSEALNLYETDLDRTLLAKKAMQDKQGEFNFKPGQIDLAEIQKRSSETKEAGAKIKEVNQQYARKIETLLPEDVQASFAKAVKRQSFPRVYKPSQVSKAIDSALKFDDLDAAQRDTLKSLQDSYEREVGPLNESWASAVEEDEKDPNNMTFGDGSFAISIGGPGDNKDTPLAKARKARREFDEQTRERLSTALTPAQREKLPKAAPGGPLGDTEEDVEVDGGGAGIVIRR